jgi:hypothetical protein
LAGSNEVSACWPADRPHKIEELATWKGPTTEQHFAKATAVFVARIVRTDEGELNLAGRTWPIVAGTFRTIEVLKGRPPEDMKVRSLIFGPGNCTIPLLAGWNYVFFLGPGGALIDHDNHNLVWWTNGSFPAPNLEATSVKPVLDDLRKLSARAK